MISVRDSNVIFFVVISMRYFVMKLHWYATTGLQTTERMVSGYSALSYFVAALSRRWTFENKPYSLW